VSNTAYAGAPQAGLSGAGIYAADESAASPSRILAKPMAPGFRPLPAGKPFNGMNADVLPQGWVRFGGLLPAC